MVQILHAVRLCHAARCAVVAVGTLWASRSAAHVTTSFLFAGSILQWCAAHVLLSLRDLRVTSTLLQLLRPAVHQGHSHGAGWSVHLASHCAGCPALFGLPELVQEVRTCEQDTVCCTGVLQQAQQQHHLFHSPSRLVLTALTTGAKWVVVAFLFVAWIGG